MYQKALSLGLAFIALVFIGSGITGFYSIDDTSNFCLDDGDCQYSVCCAIAGESYGVCGQESECGVIYEESKTGNTPQFRAASIGEEASQSYIAVALGLILLMIIAIVSYVEWHQGNHSIKKKVKKRKSKK